MAYSMAIRVCNTAYLNGTIEVQGSKNTVLPIIAATILTDGISVIHNCPDITDVHVMCELLKILNIEILYDNHVLVVNTSNITYAPLPYELTCRLRSSVLLLGAMLGRWGRAEVGRPGGCTIGIRPIDIHLEGFCRMNADINLNESVLCCQSFRLEGCDFKLRYPSVGATENLLLAACGAKGTTTLRGAAQEPEIIELCNYLSAIGVVIEGIGTDVLNIKSTDYLKSADYINVYDRIVAGTYMLIASAIPSDIILTGIDDIHYIKNIIKVCARLGLNVVGSNNTLRIRSSGDVIPGNFSTGTYPEFPTDLMPVLIAILLNAGGDSSVTETVFENRFSVVDELKKLNGRLCVKDNTVHIKRTERLSGNIVLATDLRQGAAMVAAGLMAAGSTTVMDVSYIERGYENIVRDLSNVGAKISYI